MENLETKKCTKCGFDKSIKDFYTIKIKSGNVSWPAMCKPCISEYYKDRRAKQKVVKQDVPLIYLEGEIWKDVAKYEGLYKVSNKGRLMSCAKSWPLGDNIRTKFDTICPADINKDRYHTTVLRKNNAGRNLKVHRLVAKAFIPNPENKPEINHINGIKRDNRVENLEWCTREENQRHAFKIGLKSLPSGFEHISSIGVFDTETGIFYGSLQECANATGTSYSVLKYRVSDKGRGINNTKFILL